MINSPKVKNKCDSMKWMEDLWGRSNPATKYLVKNIVKFNTNNPKPGFTS